MTFPVVPVVLPADLRGVSNGRLSSSLLRSVRPRTDWQMHHLAARAWEAMRSAAWLAGVRLSVSGNPYRSYDRQVALFTQRYTSTFDPAVNTTADKRTWNGVTYYKRIGVAAVATPGTSNHGLGLAVDTALDSDGDVEWEWPVQSLNAAAQSWLLANAARFGFSWELQSEPWHLRYVTGDQLPAAVVGFENAGTYGQWPTMTKPTLRQGSTGEAVRYLERVLKEKASQQLVVDTSFNAETDRAVRNVQAFCGIVVDGVVGPQTWGVIDRLATR